MKYFRNIGIIAVALFSFFYTEKIANLTLENNEIYKKIKMEAANYSVLAVNAVVDGENITPGLNGLEVDIKDSFFNMKDINTFNSYYLIYDSTYPKVSIDKFKDKIIHKGNPLKQSVAFVIEYNEKLLSFFKEEKIEVSVLVTKDSFVKNSDYEQINNEVNNFKDLETLINKYSNNTNICYLNNTNEDVCKKNDKYLVRGSKVVNNNTFLDIKNNVESGDIYFVDKNIDTKSIKLLINSILYKDLDIVRLSTLISEERD